MACAGFTATIWRVTGPANSMRMQQDGCLTQSEAARPRCARCKGPHTRRVHLRFPPEADGGESGSHHPCPARRQSPRFSNSDIAA